MNAKENKSTEVYIVIDIGGSKYMPGFVDAKGKILYQERREWNGVEPEEIVKQLKCALRNIIKEHPELAERTCAGGLTIPGFTDPVTGVWVESDFLKVKNLPICDLLTREFGLPFYADNDGNACALAERYFGGAKGIDDFIYLTVSTGVGGAVYLDGKLHYGAFCHAGEIGLCVMEPGGRPSDGVSVRGVLENYACGRGLSLSYAESAGIQGEDLPDGKALAALEKNGDSVAYDVLQKEGTYLGRGIANVCAFADMKKVIIGGGISLLYPKYKEALLKEYYRLQPEDSAVIEPTMLGYSGAFLGAAAVAIRGYTESEDWKEVQNCSVVLQTDAPLKAYLVNNGKRCASRKVSLGSFLLADCLQDTGVSLEKIAACTEERELGYAIGRAAACACVVYDPAEVVVQGIRTASVKFHEGFEEALKAETYYRGNIPFSIQYER